MCSSYASMPGRMADMIDRRVAVRGLTVRPVWDSYPVPLSSALIFRGIFGVRPDLIIFGVIVLFTLIQVSATAGIQNPFGKGSDGIGSRMASKYGN